MKLVFILASSFFSLSAFGSNCTVSFEHRFYHGYEPAMFEIVYDANEPQNSQISCHGGYYNREIQYPCAVKGLFSATQDGRPDWMSPGALKNYLRISLHPKDQVILIPYPLTVGENALRGCYKTAGTRCNLSQDFESLEKATIECE